MLNQLFKWSLSFKEFIRWRSIAVNLKLKPERCMDPELENAKDFDEMPHETAFPLIGSTWTFFPIIGKYNIRKQDEVAWKRYLEYGNIVREDLTPTMKIVYIYDVNDIEKVYRKEGRFPHRPPLQAFKFYREQRKDIYTNNGLLSNKGEKWYELRSKAQKYLLRPSSINLYLPAMDSIATELVHKMENIMDSEREVPNLADELYKWAFESVAFFVLDARLNCLSTDINEDSENLQLIQAVNDIFDLTFKLEYSGLKLWKRFPSRTYYKFSSTMDHFCLVSLKYINNALERIKQKPCDSDNFTFLESLLLKEEMSLSNVTTLIADLFFGGIEATSHTTGFALYQLAKNPKCQDLLYEEVCRVFPDPSQPITESLLNECRYLKATVKETMRVMPLVDVNIRVLDDDVVLSGYRVPSGVFIIAPNVVSSNLKANFPEPFKFKPERWIRGLNSKTTPFACLPFGFGPRSCIGKRLAELEIWAILIRIMQKYKVEYHYEDIGKYSKLVNAPDKPLKFTFLQR